MSKFRDSSPRKSNANACHKRGVGDRTAKDYRLIEVYRIDADIEVLDENQVLVGHDVLPDFELSVADVFADPFVE